MTYIDVIVSNGLDTNDAFVTATANGQLEIAILSIGSRDWLCEPNVVKLPHIIDFPEPLQCFTCIIGVCA
jgi:hypothetical protein